jgi:hypothetical protein
VSERNVVFNVRRLVVDCGGARAFAEIVGKSRTWPYFALRRNYLSTPILARVRAAKPELDLHSYFEEVSDGPQGQS